MNAPFEAPSDERVDLGELTGSLGFVLRLAQLRVYGRFFRAFGDPDVKPGEFTVLWVIALNPGVRQGAVARVLHIKPAHMTKLVQRLVTEGLVDRHVPPHDRRSVELNLTAAGLAQVEGTRATLARVHEAERKGLTAAENAELMRLLGKLAFAGGVSAEYGAGHHAPGY